MLTVNSPKVKAFEVGQRISWYDMANHRHGVITAAKIDDRFNCTDPSTTYNYASVLSYTCVFEDEYATQADHLVVARWVAHTRGPILTAAQIAEVVSKHEAAKKKREADKAREAEESKARIAALPSQYPHLTPASARNWGKARLAAYNLRIVLKRAFPETKFSVRSDHNAIDIVWTDGPIAEDVAKLGNQFRDAYFDGQTDCTRFIEDGAARDFTRVFGGATYIFPRRESLS